MVEEGKIEVGNFLENKETGEIVLVHDVDSMFVHYRNDDVDGQVSQNQVVKDFNVFKEAPDNAGEYISDAV